ncbi:MAG TPA: exopolysaccharide biosynthesis protein [Pseudomonas sp.]|nr:exopolysaccharide biosynthesis protein [Pseudomonas sp.]
MEAAGQRSFGPMLLLPGLIALSPLSGTPGLPSTVAVMVALIAGQLLCERRQIWLPHWLLTRSLSRSQFEHALQVLHPMARWVDRMVQPRLTLFTRGPALYANVLLCLLIALSMPPLELILFANTINGAALAALGLALFTHDGVLALLAFAFSIGSLYLLGQAFL